MYTKNKVQHLLSVIEEISHVLLRVGDWSEVRPKVIEHCCKLADAEVCALYLKDEIGKTLYLDAGVGYQHAVQEREISYAIGEDPNGADADGVTGWVAQTGQTAKADSYEDVRKLPGWCGKWDHLLWTKKPDKNFRGMLAVPLKIGGNEIIGVLKVENKQSQPGKSTSFDKNDERVLTALATVIASATQVHRLQTQPVTRAYKVAEDLISRLRPFDFFQQLVIVCKELLNAQVCALYLIDFKNDPKKLDLVAGEGYKQAIRPGRLTYELGDSEEGNDAEGVTGWIAQTGKEAGANSFEEVKKLPRWRGKWDEIQWEEQPDEHFHSMFAVPLKRGERVIGVLKIENKLGKHSVFRDTDKQILRVIARIMTESLYERLKTGLSIEQLDDFEYRAVRFKERTFEKKAVGDVIVRHSLTSICPSDVAYFLHEKDRKKLDEHLPMALGHETTGIIQYARGNITYRNEMNTRIQVGDHVVVIPLIPCGSCHVCTGEYGENYCPSSRFMASDASGSLRTQYKYYPELILKIHEGIEEHFALLTEPMSNVMQALMEFGFKRDSYEFEMVFDKEQTFSYFHVPPQSFTNIFNTITSEEPFPRTVFFLDMQEQRHDSQYHISIYNLLRKGLAIFGGGKPKDSKLIANEPRILILGSGTIGYLFALLLSKVFSIPRERLYVTGRSDEKLNLFNEYARIFKRGDFANIDGMVHHLKQDGEFDCVFECVGGPVMSENIQIAIECLRPNGCVGVIGLAEGDIPINLSRLIEKQIYLKGFFRGSLESYSESLRLISTKVEIRGGLSALIGEFHDVSEGDQLASVFEKVAQRRSFGRHIVRLI
jgi:threonine dehydrogenase-like Zn-dependent dehydrogenase/GAF domain-containing protein